LLLFSKRSACFLHPAKAHWRQTWRPSLSVGSVPALLLLPPLNCLVAACLGAALGRRRGGAALRAVGLTGLVLLSLPVVSGSLLAILESGQNPPLPPAAPPQAIVILSGDQSEILDGAGIGFRPGPQTLEREQAGAVLARRTHLPVLVSGGSIHAWSPPLADIMAKSLADDFNVDVRWREAGSIDTWANARNSAAVLHHDGITSIYLVTHAWHMKRALLAFQRAGMLAAAAPVAVDDKPYFRPSAFVPSTYAWQESYWGVHELIGWAWYAIRP
jgi:uncharacterized SAM-binding protein YcdF (DUF218 family)